jgi:hypothetical protein
MRQMAPDLVGAGGNGRQPRRRPPPSKRKTAEFRRWTTVNLTDARTDIEDTELFWAENAIPIGKGQMQTLNGPGEPIATLAQGIATLWGFELNGAPVFISVGTDGSLTMVTPGGVQTVIRGAGTVSVNAHLTPWQGSIALIIDPIFGYSSYDPATNTYTVIDATRVGESIAVFEGRVWIGHNRTITFTAPGTFNDFTIGNGAGTVILTDEAFIGNITMMLSALEQLWIIGPAAIEALSNVTASGTAPSVVTTFSLTNIITGLGSTSPQSGIGYFRAITFMSPGGLYAISGVTPQQLTERLDTMFPGLTLTPDVPAAIGLVQNLNCLLYLVTYTQATVPNLPIPANGLTTPTPLVLGFTKGKIFFASQGDTLKWITTIYVSGVAQVWGADAAGHIFQLFGAANDKAAPYKIVGKLSSFGKAVQMHAIMKIGVELQAAHPVSPTLTLDSDLGAKAFPLAAGVALKLLNNMNQILLLQNAANQTLVLRGQGIALPKQDAAMFGHYIGWTYQGNDPPHRLQAVQFEYVDTRDWNP